jgi:hypothetical protein
MKEELKVIPHDYAYPQPYQECMSHMRGITMRDYFAAKALQGMLSNPETDYTLADYVRGAFKISDAMMEARK